MEESGNVESNTRDGITTITFFHPLSNSLPGNLLRKLSASIVSAGENQETRVIVLKSAGEKVFCAGASFDELSALENTDDAKNFFCGFADVINAIRKAPCFVIARIQGKAVGGGVGLAAAADYSLALESSSVKLSELAVGIGPFVVGPAVERKTGLSAFSELAINAGEWRDASWARDKGLFAGIFPSIEILDREVLKLASTLANSNPQAMKNLKEIFWKGTENWSELLNERAEISGKLVLSSYSKNAISKFKSGVR